MKVTPTEISDVLIIEPDVFGDERGFFFESYNRQAFASATGINCEFVQDNRSLSLKGVLRGLHYQIKKPQAKLVQVISGEVYDVAVDIRKRSSTFGQWVSANLSAENKKQMWVPEGFAHGFIVLSDSAELLYKTSNYYSAEFERCIRWDDQELAISWPLTGAPVLSEKDTQGIEFKLAEVFK